MCSESNAPRDKDINGECPECGAPTEDGFAGGCCYGELSCPVCEYRPCDGSC